MYLFALIFVEKDTSYRKKTQVVKRKDKEKPLGEYEVTPSGMDGIISLTRNEVKAESESAEGKKRDTRIKFGANERRKKETRA